jgi:Ca2+-binding RTX toxin-like protein
MATPDNFANVLIGTSGNDIIHGLGGNDIIEGGAGVDQMFGDADNDAFRFRGAYVDSNEIADGGAGDHDKLDLSLVDYSSLNVGIQTVTSTVFVDLSQNTFGATLIFNHSGRPIGASSVISKVYNVEDVTGSSGNDIIIGNALNNIINGGAGIDSLSAGGGNDTFLVTGRWFDNGDAFDGGTGTDTIDFSGVDYTDASRPSTFAVMVADLSDGIAGSIVSPSGDIWAPDARVTEATVRNIENVVGSKYSDIIIGNALANTLSGGDGADELDGGAGLDTIYGGKGGDVIKVSGNYDTVGVDKIDGGEGIDTVDFSDLTYAGGNPFAVVDLVTGSYSLGYRSGPGGGFQFSSIGGVFNVENFIGTTSGESKITASAAANNITGGSEDDTVSYQHSTAGVTVERDPFAQDAYAVVRGGYAQGDTLNDIEFIVGSAFNDRLIGIEEVTGGRGADTFSLLTAKITDFRASEGDVIEIAPVGGIFNTVRGISDLTWSWSASERVWLLAARDHPDVITRVVMPDGKAPVTAADVANAFTDDMFVFKAKPGTGWINGSDAANTLTGTAAANTLVGLGGNDVLTGNGGADRMYGGDHNDRFVMNGAYQDKGDVVDGGRGVDTLDFSRR